MARLQILELPEGAGDERPPFVLVLDQVDDDLGEEITRWPEDVAKRIGARQILCFPGTIDIPANDLSRYNGIPDGDWTAFAATVERVLGIDTSTAVPDVAGWLLTACRELEKSEAARAKLRHLVEQLDEARQWARHGYEIGQKHCSWSDHGVAPEWLTEGWPPHIDSCEHLQQAAEYDEALSRVRAEVARIHTITPTWGPVADLIDAALNGTQQPAEQAIPDA